MEDAKIVELYWQRSNRAITESADKYGNYCFSIAHHILSSREDADECVNDTWLGAWNAMPPHRPNRLSTFLGKITRRLALTSLRRDNRLKRGGGEVTLAYEELADCLSDGDKLEEQMDAQALRDVIDAFLAGLPREQRDVFVCRYWCFASIEEIATKTGYSQSKVKSMLYRTRQRLGQVLYEEGFAYDRR